MLSMSIFLSQTSNKWFPDQPQSINHATCSTELMISKFQLCGCKGQILKNCPWVLLLSKNSIPVEAKVKVK